MNDNQIRQIVREELARNQQQARFNLNVNPNVRHTGIDAFPINAGNLAPGQSTSGSVTMTSVGNYTFKTNFRPSQVTFYGNPYHKTGVTYDRHTFVFGQAALSQNLYFQPDNGTNPKSNSVKTGGLFEIVQTSTMFMALDSGGNTTFQAVAGQDHLINVQESGSVVARASVSNYGPSSFTITVNTLASGWVIVGNYFVS